MKVTYVGNTERNGKKRKVTYTGALGPDVMPDKRSPKATYVGVDTSKGSSDGVAWHTNKDSIQANKEYFNPQKQNDYNISALGAGNYGADKRVFGKDYNVGQGLAKAGQLGLTQFAKAGSSAGAWIENLLGDIAREGTNGYWDPDTSQWLFNRWNRAIDTEAEGVQQRYAENTAKGGKAAEVLEDMGAAAVATLPQVAAAILTGGASTAATAEQLAARAAASQGVMGTISRAMQAMGKDPNFKLAFAQVAGPGYEQAKADGADDLRASLYAIGNGLMNAAVEAGGGIQKLPNNVGNQAAWRTLVDTMIDEGKEEVLQGIIDRTLQNVVYGADNPYFGVNENAIFDPGTAADEFAGGAIVGGLLSGGTMGVNALANRAAYGAAKAQYNRDVRQNTAPEMGSKAAEAVDAVTRGESITGNQAAAIARDPVAMETLEANTGVNLNTEQPLSALKKEIQAVSTRSMAQETQTAATPTPAAQKRTQRTVGGFMEAGQKAYQTLRQTADNEADLYAGFSSVYNAGLNGIEASKAKGKYADLLTPEQRYAAYNAGLEDARAQLAQENAEVASVTTTAGAGLANNEYSRAIIAIHKNTAAVLNSVGKKLGVRIEFVDSVMDGRANGQYIKDKNLIQIAGDSDKPYLFVAAHEITHRMQDLSPAEYREFRKAALEYRMQQDGADTVTNLVQGRMDAAARDGVTLTQDEVMDEIAADFAGDMLDDIDLFERFAKDNRTVAQKLLDSLKEFIAKVKAIFTGKARDKAAQEAYGKDFAELEDIAKQWQAAFDAAERQAGISSSVRPGDTVQYDDAVYSLRVTDKDTLDFLDKQKTITTYKTMQLVDGKLYPPMAARVDGRYEDASELGKWEMAVERPDLVKDGKFKLDKGKGQGSLMAAYNPYMHSSNLVLNDQFSGAYTRDNLVTVECEVPVSEMTSGYHADGAKDSVGWHSWHTGTVAGQVRKATGVERQVFLSRWIKPVRILSNAEVAGMYKKLLGNTEIAVPDNVVTPGLLAELKKAGVPIKESGRVKAAAGEGDGVRFSLKSFSEQAVSTALYDALNEKATRQNQLIPVSIMPRYISETLGINGNIYIQRDHAYENMVSKAQAIQDGRPTQHKGEEVHFHDLGVEKMTRAIMSINEPIMTISTKTKDGNPAVIMMLPEYGNNDAPLYAVLSFYSRKAISSENREMRPHVVLTIAERNFFENGGRVGWDKLIRNAIKDGRVLDYNKKERGNLSEVAQPAGLGDITDASLKENLAQFQKEVKRFKEGNNIRYQLRSAAEVEQEIRDLKRERTVLASRNRALEQRVQELKGEMRISKEPSVVLRDVKKLGLNTIRQYGSDVNYADIQPDMEALGKSVMKKDVSMADLMPYAKSAAKTIVENTSELTEYGAELLDIRDYLKQQHIRFNGDMAYYEDFRKSHMGTLKLSKTKGTSVDTVYAELTEMFGEGYFPSDVYTEADKLQQIVDVIDNTDAIYANPFESYKDAAIQEIANDIIDGMISDQVREKHTFADRKALEKQEAVGRVRNMLDKERQKRKEQVKQLRNQYAEKTAQGRESRKATALRAQIARHTGAMSNKLLHPTDAKHIPENLRVLVANLLKSINLESSYSLKPGTEHYVVRKDGKRGGLVGEHIANGEGTPTKRTQYVKSLQAAYEDIINREGSMVVDPDLLDTGGLLDQVERLGDKRVADMSSSELEVIWKAIRAIEKTLTTYDKTLSTAKYQSTSEWASRLAAESTNRKARWFFEWNTKKGKHFEYSGLDMFDPYTFFAAFGDSGMQVYRVLRNAQDQEHVMLMELQREAAKFLDKNVYENRFDRHTFQTGGGASLTLTTEQIMNLYNLARRGEQAVNHLMKGGIVQPFIPISRTKSIPRGSQNIPLTMEDIQAITSVLTPEQIRVAKGLQKLASSMLAEWGNNASMTVYGYRKFTEEHYWPIKAAKDAVSTSSEKDPGNSRSIKNMGSAKALVPDASNALEIGGIYDVFAQNASDMIKYATLLAPMEDINRLYNFRYRDDKGNLTGRNVQQVISKVYGRAGNAYWENLVRDVQNGMIKNASDTTRAVERIVGNTKGAAVGANLRVVIQQPTAYCRAAVVLDPTYMAKGLTKGATAGNGWDKARQWAPIAGIKDTSGFDQGSRYTVAREVYGSDGGALEWLNDKSMALAGKADAVTWGKIWNACEWQVASETNLEVGSDAYYRQVAAVFTDVIDQTQVVDGIMQRTQIMRDGDMLFRQATSFMGEPLKSLNIFMRAYDAWAYENNPQKRSAALKRLKRSVAALVVTDVVNALAQSIVDGLRDDDKDKNWAERILEAFTGYSGDEESAGEVIKNVTLGGNLVSNMNPVGRIPYLQDILSILQGYTVDRMDAAAADDIIRTSKTFIKGLGGDSKTTTAYNLKQMLVMGSKVFGISVGNMGRDMWAIARSIANDTGNVRFMFEMEKAIYRMDKSAGNRKRWCELLYRAQKDKDTETARLIYKEMLEHGYEEKDVRMGVEAIMKKEQKVESVNDLKTRWTAP